MARVRSSASDGLRVLLGTSVAAFALLTYARRQASFFFVTISKQRIRSSAADEGQAVSSATDILLRSR